MFFPQHRAVPLGIAQVHVLLYYIIQWIYKIICLKMTPQGYLPRVNIWIWICIKLCYHYFTK